MLRDEKRLLLKKKAYAIVMGSPRLNRRNFILRSLLWGIAFPCICVAIGGCIGAGISYLPSLAALLATFALLIPFALVAYVILFISNLSSIISRLHDLNRSGWWFLLGVWWPTGLILWTVLSLWPGSGQSNEFGEPQQ